MEFDEVINGRRSIRGYKPDPVPRALIEEIIGLAMRAPSSMNTQPWNFYVITGEPLDRIRAGNTERMVAGVPQSREFRTGDASLARTATARSAWPSSCSPPWA
jgi:nitroreductase